MARWPSRIEHGGGSAGLSETAENGEKRASGTYIPIEQYDTIRERSGPEPVFWTGPPYLRFDSCIWITYAEVRSRRKGDIGLPLLHFQYSLYRTNSTSRTSWSKRGIWLNQCKIYWIRSGLNLHFDILSLCYCILSKQKLVLKENIICPHQFNVCHKYLYFF